MHANRLMPNVYRKKLLAFTINKRESYYKKNADRLQSHYNTNIH